MELNSKTKKENDVADDYLSSLSDLNCNSKPLINMLTMLAEENIEYAAVIVKVVEQHIAKVPADFKLPILYLIDSIVKNVKGTYVQLFSQCIVNIFCGVFEKVNEKVRERMYALRQTWNEVFLTQKLYALDVKVKRIDNNWPITAKQPQPSIHVNPNFLKTVSAGQAATLPTDMEEILHAKTRELLELKKRKLELELEATKKHLEEQEKQLTKATESVIPPVDVLVAAGASLPPTHIRAQTMMPGGMIPPDQQNPVMRPGLYNHNFRNPRPPSHLVGAAGMMNVPPQGYPPMVNVTNMGKPKVHPVNPALLNTIRHRDPRLARQQQQQQQHQIQLMQTGRNGDGGVSSQSARSEGIKSQAAISSLKSDGVKSNPLPSSSYRGSSKSSRSGGNAGSGSEGKSPTRHSSSRSVGLSSSGSSKNKTSRIEKDSEQRKRSESKSSTTSSSSIGSSSGSSSSTDRRKNKQQPTVKCDKDAFEIAPLSMAFKRKSSSPPGDSPTKTKDSKRGSKSRNYAANVVRSSKSRRSHSPSPSLDGAALSKDVDLRTLANVAVVSATAVSSPEKRLKVSDTEEASSEAPAIANVSSKDLDKNIKNVLEPVGRPLSSGMMDVDLRQQLLPDAAVASTSAVAQHSVVVIPEASRIKTVATSSPKVSFKIQKLFNKLEKSTEHLSTASSSSTIISTAAFKAPATLSRRKSDNITDYDVKEEDDSCINLDLARQTTATMISKLSEPMSVDSINDDDGKKRASANSAAEEPLAKKSKSAKLDMLFGSEDVDLRNLIPPQILAAQKHHQQAASSKDDDICPPPPPLITEEESSSQHNIENWDSPKTTKLSSPSANPTEMAPAKKSSLEDVRAKLARQTAKYNKFGKFDKSNRELSQRFKLAELNQNEDTQEANDEKIRNILSQAQELLQSNSINNEQYRSLVQTVMSINETNKLKEANRRDSCIAATSKQAKMLSPTRENDDEETAEEESLSDAERNAARDAVLKKRIPKLPKSIVATLESKSIGSPLSDGGGNDSPLYDSPNDESNNTKVPKEKQRSKEKRLKQSKWGDRIDPATTVSNLVTTGAHPPRVWPTARFRGSVPHPPMPPQANPHLRMPQLPWHQQPPPPHFLLMRGAAGSGGNVPPPPLPPVESNPAGQSITKPCNSIDNPQTDLVRNITIDGATKEIRIYDQVAIVFMENDQPREISFQAGQRSIIIDNQPPIALQFNNDYRTITIAGQPARIRFGLPSRELYIDEHWYEIYFGGPAVTIPLRQKIHVIKAEGPPPQVNIGSLRRDLVVGKINMIVDAHIIVALFLDARPQRFRLGERDHILQFADQLATVLLDGEPTRVEYGGLPKSLTLGGTKYFVRFGALPHGVIAGQVKIRDMAYVNMEKPQEPEPPKTEMEPSDTTNSSTVITTTSEVKPLADDVVKTDEEVSQLAKANAEPATAALNAPNIPLLPAAVMNTFNIDELFQKLVSSGILGGNNTVTNAATSVSTVLTASVEPLAAATVANAMSDEVAVVTQELIRPINLAQPETIKTRQSAIVSALFSGLQCSSCGVRFPPEQTIKYSQHLDWHFRQNRRERDSSRKAHSRKWYYGLTDWLQYEEIEDLDEREKNFFETQSNDAETALDDASNQQRSSGSPLPSCAAGPNDVERACDMCQERFEQFYNEELDEWRLRSAIRVDEKIYHPLCYEDYKASLNPPKPEENKMEIINGEDDNAMDVIIKIEEDKPDDDDAEKASVTIADDDDDDDVIVLPNEEPSVTEIDDDEEEYVPVNVTREEMGTEDNVDVDTKTAAAITLAGLHEESDVEIQEPNIPFTDLDTYVEKELPEGVGDEASQLSFTNMKIKEEPKDDEEEDEDDGFEDVGTVVILPEEEISVQSSEDTQNQTVDLSASMSVHEQQRPPSAASLGGSSTHLDDIKTTAVTETTTVTTDTIGAAAPAVDLNISMDGNLVEPEDEHNLSTAGPAPTIPLASLVNRIKINITKNIISANSSSSTNSATTITTTTTTTNPHNNILNCNESTSSAASTIPVLCSGSTSIAATTAIGGAGGECGCGTTRSSSPVSSISVIGSYGITATSNTTARFHSHVPPAVVATIPAVIPRLPTPPPPVAAVEESITYEIKPALQKVTLKKAKKVDAGVETSGLCSIM